MINLLPEPKFIHDEHVFSKSFDGISFLSTSDKFDVEWFLDIAKLRFWNYPSIYFSRGETQREDTIKLNAISNLDGISVNNDDLDLFVSQGYYLKIKKDEIILKFNNKAGYINGITSIKQLIQEKNNAYVLPCCEITDWPSIPVRAIAPTFSWYAGYGRIGFDSQLWGFDEWVEYLNIALDNKINQFNLLMYGFWPFELAEYPETVFSDVPVKIWNAENRRWLIIRYTHPNLEDPYLEDFIELAHKLEVNVFAYVGLNSYNGAYSIAHPEARMKPPTNGRILK
jgi:hypothetical protein